MHKSILFILVCFCTIQAQAQKTVISGYVRDADTKEALIGATVVSTNEKIGTSTNQYGYYSLSVPSKDTLEILFSYQGYDLQAKQILNLNKAQVNVLLGKSLNTLGEITVVAGRNNYNVEKPQMGVIDVPIKAIKNLPVIMGERDVMKIIQLLPGVQAGQEGTAGFYVRGGNLDQNLVQLDEATVYNPNHLLLPAHFL